MHLPPARIKKMMKVDPDVKMIAGDTPHILARACELFLEEMTKRA